MVLHLAEPAYRPDKYFVSGRTELTAQMTARALCFIEINTKRNYLKLIGPSYFELFQDFSPLLLADSDDPVGDARLCPLDAKEQPCLGGTIVAVKNVTVICVKDLAFTRSQAER
jgi:hypothetical protein